jgi:Phage terminase large subunit
VTIDLSAQETTVEYEWRDPQIELIESTDDELVAVGPMGVGKTAAVLSKINFYCSSVSKTKVLMVRKTAASLAYSALDIWREEIVPHELASGAIRFFDPTKDEPGRYEYDNGSIIVIGGLDKSEKWWSTQFDIVYVNECTELTEHDWEVLITRTRNGRLSFNQLIGDCNPDKDDHWLLGRAERGVCKMVKLTHEDNPRMFDRATGKYTKWGLDYLRKLGHLSGVNYQRWVRGIWCSAEGVIWEAYDPAIHLIEPFEIPREWPRFWSVDWGYGHPFVWQCWVRSPDGVLYLVHEIYYTRRTVRRHAQTVLETIGLQDPEGNWYIPHWEMPYKINTDHNLEDIATFEEVLGVTCELADKDVLEGIKLTQERFADHRIFFFTDSLVEVDQTLVDRRKPFRTVGEFGGYVWRNPKLPGEGPNKFEDDGSDAMRYRVMDEDSIEEMEVIFG